MFKRKTHNSVASIVLGLACLAAPSAAPAAEPVRLSGSITGVVTDSFGVRQMGATVLLLNRQERTYEKVATDERGEFKFLGLFPDVYSIRVTLSTFVPALKRNILVQPGILSMLNVSLNSLFSTIQLVIPPGDNRAFMTDEWKWVLRSAAAARPVLRFKDEPAARLSRRTTRTAMFSETRGILKVSGGDGSPVTGSSGDSDLGTGFALATSLYGNNLLKVSGNVGYGSQTGAPSAAFRTSYSRNVGEAEPQVSVTMRQLFVPGRLGSAITGSETGLPVLRSMSASFDDTASISENLSVQYGFSLDSVTFLDRLNYFSPYARLKYSRGKNSELDFAYTSGNARPELGASSMMELQSDLNALGQFPRVSLLGGRAKVQRGEDLELSYARTVGSRVFQVTGYRESVSNAALTISAPAGLYSGGDILPDLFGSGAIFNAGDYATLGYMLGVTQNVNEHLSATLMYGSLGGLTAENRELVSHSPDELRSMIHAGRRHTATARVAATSPWSGTHLIASYQWTPDRRWASPGHMYSTQSVRPMPGLNLYVRQPIPGFSMLPWRMEATADLRNILAQGYLPLGMMDGQSLVLVQTPRSFRGGLSFIF